MVPSVLNVGEYSVGLWMGTGYEDILWRSELLSFRLEADSQARSERILQLKVPWELIEVDHEQVGQISQNRG